MQNERRSTVFPGSNRIFALLAAQGTSLYWEKEKKRKGKEDKGGRTVLLLPCQQDESFPEYQSYLFYQRIKFKGGKKVGETPF